MFSVMFTYGFGTSFKIIKLSFVPSKRNEFLSSKLESTTITRIKFDHQAILYKFQKTIQNYKLWLYKLCNTKIYNKNNFITYTPTLITRRAELV